MGNGTPGKFCSPTCRVAATGNKKLTPTDPKYNEIKDQFNETWDTQNTSKIGKPTIKAIWELNDVGIYQKFSTYADRLGPRKLYGKGKNPGNKQRRFHGTSVKCTFNGTPCGNKKCKQCCIIAGGWQMKYCSQKGLMFGKGIYSTSSS